MKMKRQSCLMIGCESSSSQTSSMSSKDNILMMRKMMLSYVGKNASSIKNTTVFTPKNHLLIEK